MTTHDSLHPVNKESIMTDQDIFAALAQVRKGAVALTCATRTLVLQLEEDLRRLDACCGGEGAGRAFARAFVDEVVRPVRQVVEALRDFVDPFEDLPTDAGDSTGSAEPAAEQRSGCIHFERLLKLHEPYVLEKTIEVYGKLRGDDETRLFRLQGMRPINDGGLHV